MRAWRASQFPLVHEQRARPPAARGNDVLPPVTALAIPVRHTLRIEHAPDLVRLVAVHAGGNHVRFLFPQLATDDFAVHRLDAGVALAAGLGDVLLGNRRARIGVGQDEMRGVATGAHRRHDQATAKQSFAVNTFRVVFENLALWDRMRELDRRALVVATPAQTRDFGRRGG